MYVAHVLKNRTKYLQFSANIHKEHWVSVPVAVVLWQFTHTCKAIRKISQCIFSGNILYLAQNIFEFKFFIIVVKISKHQWINSHSEKHKILPMLLTFCQFTLWVEFHETSKSPQRKHIAIRFIVNGTGFVKDSHDVLLKKYKIRIYVSVFGSSIFLFRYIYYRAWFI